jgi:hypothetical protein
MAGNKTVPTIDSVEDFVDALDNPQRQRDCREMIGVMRAITGEEPVMWGGGMVGFGRYHYRYDSGREGEFFLTGFAPRKSAFTVYVMPGLERYAGSLQQLGPHRTGRSCLYLKTLGAVDRDVLADIIRDSVDVMRQRYPES